MLGWSRAGYLLQVVLAHCWLLGSLWMVLVRGICRNEWRRVAGSVVLARCCGSFRCMLDCDSAILVGYCLPLVMVGGVIVSIVL